MDCFLSPWWSLLIFMLIVFDAVNVFGRVPNDFLIIFRVADFSVSHFLWPKNWSISSAWNNITLLRRFLNDRSDCLLFELLPGCSKIWLDFLICASYFTVWLIICVSDQSWVCVPQQMLSWIYRSFSFDFVDAVGICDCRSLFDINQVVKNVQSSSALGTVFCGFSFQGWNIIF